MNFKLIFRKLADIMGFIKVFFGFDCKCNLNIYQKKVRRMEQRIKVVWGKKGNMLLGRQIKEHCHTCYQLYYILSGEARFIVGGQEFRAPGGSCFLIPPMVYHLSLPIEEEGTVCLDFKMLIQDPELQQLLVETPERFADTGPLRKQLLYVEENWISRDPAKQKKISDLLYALLLTFGMERIRAEEKPGSRHVLTDGYSDLTCSVLAYIERNYAYPFSLEELGSVLNYNKNYLCSAFRKNTGFCIIDYLNFIRIRHAVICFAFYGQDVGITCEVTGFSNLSHFSRTFKAFTGLPPREFRRAFTLSSAEVNSKIFAEEPILGYRICALEEAINSLKHIGQTAANLLASGPE